MKLCRFELRSDPGVPRSGMVFSGRIYETDGAQAIGVHEADAVRPLTPVPQPASLRFFHQDLQLPSAAGPLPDEPSFFYGNPACLASASQMVNHPEFSAELGFDPYLGVVLVADAYKLEPELADDVILGYTILNFLVARDVERAEHTAGAGYGRSHDIGGVFGPVITTPDELEDVMVSSGAGKGYQLSVVTRVNGVEIARGNVEDLPFTAAQAISAASQSCTLRSGDLLALGPLVSEGDEPVNLRPGDEVQVSIEILGTLSLKLSQIL